MADTDDLSDEMSLHNQLDQLAGLVEALRVHFVEGNEVSDADGARIRAATGMLRLSVSDHAGPEAGAVVLPGTNAIQMESGATVSCDAIEAWIGGDRRVLDFEMVGRAEAEWLEMEETACRDLWSSGRPSRIWHDYQVEAMNRVKKRVLKRGRMRELRALPDEVARVLKEWKSFRVGDNEHGLVHEYASREKVRVVTGGIGPRRFGYVRSESAASVWLVGTDGRTFMRRKRNVGRLSEHSDLDREMAGLGVPMPDRGGNLTSI